MRCVDKISVIVPNNNRDLINLKMSLANSTHQNYELIEVNEGKERSEQRNIGIQRATGDYLLFLDSDQFVSFGLMEECLAKMKWSYALYIPEIIVTKGLFGRIRNWERQFYKGTDVDVVRFVRRRNCPLFDTEQKGTEDSDWDRRVNGWRDTTFNPVYHKDDIGVWDYFAKKAYYAQSLKRFAERNPNDRILDFKYRCWTVYTENGKWQKLFHPYIFGLLLILLIRGIIYLCSKKG